ncbi:MAG: hypothetical protein LC102_05535 [Ignavibacteriales bacterium]|nr:MAG: hypothetical protein F9K26_06570 [Ignavibacteriaceae bacterium]MBW7873229.1 hypothetical protein [Ignavibacteria bacterium]MCZ2142871.1 hypothetical protein [Ignavibacteriales bacterium]OQY70993.1 MAG: hypothetical protein B6D45_10640 [Ignavibacteriales bacterium UTCHB3]MBV6443965.1 hypothetical protein [Ignavibacteriaceae bacterium]
MFFKRIFFLFFFLSAVIVYPQDGYILPQTGHWGTITSAQYTADGKYIITASEDNTLILWDAETLDELQVFDWHNDAIVSFALLDDSSTVVSLSKDGMYSITDFKSDSLVATGEVPEGTILQLFKAGDGNSIVLVTDQGELYIFDKDSEEPESAGRLPVTSFITVDYDPVNERFAVASESGEITLFDAGETEPLGVLAQSSKNKFRKLLFSPDGNYVAGISDVAGSGDNSLIYVWDTQTHQIVFSTTAGKGYLEQINFLNSSGTLIYSLSDVKIAAYDLATKTEVFSIKPTGEITALAVSPDDQKVVTAYFDFTLKQWIASKQTIINEFSPSVKKINSVKTDAQGSTYLFSLELADFFIWKNGSEDQNKFLPTWDGNLGAYDLSPSGNFFAFGGTAGNVKIFDTENSIEVSNLSVDATGGVKAIKWYKNDELVAIGAEDNSLVVKNVNTGRVQAVFKGAKTPVSAIDISPDNSMIAAGTIDGTVLVWRINGGSLINEFAAEEPSSILSLAFIDEGKKLISASENGEIIISETENDGQTIIPDFESERVTSLAVSPKGDLIAVASENNPVVVTSPEDTSFIQEIGLPTGQALQVMFSANAEYIFVVHSDGNIYIFNINTGNLIGNLYFFKDGEWAFINPDNEIDCSESAADYLRYIRNNQSFKINLDNFPGYKPGLANLILF